MLSGFYKKFLKNKLIGNIVIVICSIILIYISISLYFTKHFFFNTIVNGVDLSLKNHNAINSKFNSFIDEYSLEIIDRSGQSQIIKGDILEKGKALENEEFLYNNIKSKQKSFGWLLYLFKENKYSVDDVYTINEKKLSVIVDDLDIFKEEIISPENVKFIYNNGKYEMIEEVYGNEANKEKVYETIKMALLNGKKHINLDEEGCYESPKYTINSDKAKEIQKELDKYVSTNISYLFDEDKEVLSGDRISTFININNDLDIELSKEEIKKYIKELSDKYNTIGITRKFKTSTGNTVEVEGGYYGYKINSVAETSLLLENIKNGAVIEKEPSYSQKALFRGENDIGDTYIEINISKQYMWFYKEGKIIAQGSVVTGDPRKGNSTDTGTYMINYKQKEAVLRGANYEAKVNYWMPFNGNIGIHDANWRYNFGGQIYLNDGTHGCVNATLSLAKKIYENIDAGTPVICYKE
ncbi:L,D-transpeptidase family protein [Clostridium tertium]|uniref:Peptidoglycan binding domain protein n=1 Tax=Clostridium tertium TaxID=1559 RepID=A0A6N3A928_9CLOT